MRSSANWRKALLLVALLAGGGADFDTLIDAFELEFALLIDASGDTRLTAGMRQRLHWTATGNSQ